MSSLLRKLFNLFESDSYGKCLEKFVMSKNPTSIAEVEYWAREYDLRMRKEYTCH